MSDNQNVSVELSKELYDLGLRSFAFEYWIKPTKDHWNYKKEHGEPKFELMVYNQGIDETGGDADGRDSQEWTVADEFKHPSEFHEVYAAYNFSEIRAIVPHNVAVNENVNEVGYKFNDSPVDKWARLMVYLLKNKMVTLTDIEKGYA